MQTQLAVILLITFFQSLAQPREIRGTVFENTIGNFQMDPGEPGIPGVVISDQDAATITDTQGTYRFVSKPDLPYVFVSQPKGYTVKYYYPKAPKIDFPLMSDRDQNYFKFIYASDTHVDSFNLPRMEQFRKIADAIDVAFIVISGDLIRDALRVDEKSASDFYRLYLDAILKFRMPVYSGLGNHEIFGIEREKSLVGEDQPLYGKKMFRHFLGPDYYSFNYGGIHFMAIDGVDYQNLYYYGGVDSLQLQWIENDLKSLSLATPVITINHIPFVSPGFSFMDFEGDIFYGPQLLLQQGKQQHRHIVYNFNEIQKRIGDQPYPLALPGHYHVAMESSVAEGRTRFAQTVALTRPDQFDYHGIPARSGFTLYEVKDGHLVSAVLVPLKYPGK